MEEQQASFAKKRESLVPVIQHCKECNNAKQKYLAGWESPNKDYRQYCWKCKMITNHTPPTIKAPE
jgi:ribosomal protein L44E